MEAGAVDPLCPTRPSEGEEKPKSAEVQDDGYETSNSGEALRRKPSSAEGSPAPAPVPPDYRHFQQQYQDYHYPYPKYEPYAFKREPEPHYDQQGCQFGPPDPNEHKMDMYEAKRDCDDPYSFVEDESLCPMLAPQHQPQMLHHQHPHMQHQQQMLMAQPKKRGRKKKVKDENGMEIKLPDGMPRPVKERKKHDRFNGMSEEEVARRILPDHLAENLDIIIIGINPGLFAAYKGHHYAGPGNHFWKCLYLSGLTREQMSADEDYKLLNFGIGFTNMVSRPTKGSADLTRREIKEGGAILLEKLQTFRPKIAVFNGKLIYEVFSGKKDFCFGKQPDTVTGTNTYMWVMPSSSARCAQLPRAADKVPFYAALRKFRDYLNGLIPALDENELIFPDNTARRPQDELEVRRLTMEPEPGETIVLEDGTEVPLKKKRGRPKKVKLENGEVAPPVVRVPRPRAPPCAPGETPKKKRGRPKKNREGESPFAMPIDPYMQQQQQPPAAEFPAQASNPDQQMLFNQMHHQMEQHHNYFQQGQGPVPVESVSVGVGASDSSLGYCDPQQRGYSPRPYAHSPHHSHIQHHSQSPSSGPGFSPPRQSFPSPARCSPLYASPTPKQSNEPFPRPFTRSPSAPFAPSPSSFASPYSAHESPNSPTSYANEHRYNAQQAPVSVEQSPLCPGSSPPPLPATLDFEPPERNEDNEHIDEHKVQCNPGPADLSGPVGGSTVQQGMFDDRYLNSPTEKDVAQVYTHYEHGGSVSVGSPRMDHQQHQQMQQHTALYGNAYARSSSVGAAVSAPGSPYSPHGNFRPNEHTPHTPGSVGSHEHLGVTGSPGEFPPSAASGSKPVDVSSKSLSGLESLVDQIPSIAEGEPPPAPAPPACPLPDYPAPLYAPPYAPYAPYPQYSAYGGWPWQYGYGGGYYPSHYYPSAPAPPAPYLPPPPLLDHLHKQDSAPHHPPPSVGFGSYC